MLSRETLARFVPPKPQPTPAVSSSGHQNGGTTPWGRALLQGEVGRIRDAVPGASGVGRNDAMWIASARCGEAIASGELGEGEARSELYAAGAGVGLVAEGREAEMLDEIDRGIARGKETPRGPENRSSIPGGTEAKNTPPINGLSVPDPVADPEIDHEPAPTSGAADLPEVLVPGAHRDDEDFYTEIGADDFVSCVLGLLPAGVLYRRGPHVGELDSTNGAVQFREVALARVRTLVDQHVRLVEWKPTKKGPARKRYVNCGRDHAELIREHALRSPTVRELDLLTSYPVLVGDFTPLLAGWNAEHRAFYDEPTTLRGLQLITDAQRVRDVLADLVADFPFKGEADRENFYGLLLTPIIRPAIPQGKIPMTMVEASMERTGKTKLAAEVGGTTILGCEADIMTMAGSEEEREKRVIGILRAAETFLVLDNLDAHEVLDSAVLSALLTSRRYKGRTLGKNENPTYPNNLTIVCTGNNPKTSGEIAKRIVPITLQPTRDDPENRSDYVHPDLSTYLHNVRPTVLGALLGMVEVWRTRGRPKGGPTKGGFEQWAQTVGGILRASGFTAWRTNEAEWIKRANPEGEDLRTLVAAWAERWPTTMQSAKDIYTLVEELNLFPDVTRAKDQNGRLVSFARRVLRRHLDRPVGNYVIRAQGAGSVSLYYLDGAGK